MKIIIDSEKKELIIVDSVSSDDLFGFIAAHNLNDYAITGYDTSTHWYRDFNPVPFSPPYKVTCTGGDVKTWPIVGMMPETKVISPKEWNDRMAKTSDRNAL